MARYAKGRKALAISDRSGFRIPYHNLKTEWTGFRVEPEEYEPKNPQLTPPKNIIDATALFKPRPDNDPENIIINVAFNWFNTNETKSLDSTLYKRPNVGASGKGSIGIFELEIPVVFNAVGVRGVGQVSDLGGDSPVASIDKVGVAGTGSIGTETLSIGPVVTISSGVAGTGAIGGFGETDGSNITISLAEAGVAGTGAIGTEIGFASIDESGLGGTGAIGTYSISITYTGWGDQSWGDGTWGN